MAGVMEVALDVMDAPWEWGTNDCCASACEVFRRLHGIDPMADMRGTYATEREALRIIAGFGGFTALIETFAAQAGLRPSGAVAGALGVHGHSLVICARPGVWLGKTLHGITTVSSAEAACHVAA
jgi:hypothetical protein